MATPVFRSLRKVLFNTNSPLKCGHPSNKDTFTGPKGGRFRGVPLYIITTQPCCMRIRGGGLFRQVAVGLDKAVHSPDSLSKETLRPVVKKLSSSRTSIKLM